MAKKKTNYNKSSVEKLPNDKPVVYRIETEGGRPNYVGIAKRGRVQECIQEHIGTIPGASVKIEQNDSIQKARDKEARIIKQSQPKYNKQGK